MNTRFNFLVQIALVAMFFGFSTVDGFGQFNTGASSSSTVLDDDGTYGLLPCLPQGTSISTDLLLILNNVHSGSSDFETYDFGCDLHVGITYDGVTTYTPISSLEELEVDDDFKAENSDVDGQFLALKIDWNLPSFVCKGNDASRGFVEVMYTLNLYCFDGEEYSEFDPCSSFNFQLLAIPYFNCSLSKNFRFKVCCQSISNPQGEPGDLSIKNGLINNDGSQSILTVGFINNSAVISSNNDSEIFYSYKVFNLNGQIVLEGNLIVEENHSKELDLSYLDKGMYVILISENRGDSLVKKFVKM